MSQKTLNVTCCIAGGGPAGMMLGFLLARAGVEVAVLEKHADFLRDFRGDTVHPSTLEVIHELGLLDDFLTRPHQKMPRLAGKFGDYDLEIADFSHLKVRAPYIAFMPQWDFLDFLAGHGKAYPNFHLLMQAEITSLIEEQGAVRGAIAKAPQGELRIGSELLVGADGRHSKVRDLAGLRVKDYGAPIDVLWFRLSKHADDPPQTLGRFLPGKILVTINRGDYWQCGYVIPKGESETIHRQGLEHFRNRIVEASPALKDRVAELKDWEQVKLLTVKVDFLKRWHRPGLLCIGDAAHAMSPVGGVGINLAIQDAVAAANILAEPLRKRRVTENDLAAVQKRRTWPTRMTQRLQLFMHKNLIYSVLASNRPFPLPWGLRLIRRFPRLRRITGYIVGIGFKAEHARRFSTRA